MFIKLIYEIFFQKKDFKPTSVALDHFQTLPQVCRKMEAVKLLQEIQSVRENLKLKKSEKDKQQGLAQHRLLRQALAKLSILEPNTKI